MSTTVPTTTDSGAPPPDRVTRVFTFGYGHVCPYTGQPLIDTYATVIAPSAEQCRALMLAVFGRQWAFEYVSVDVATRGGQFPMTEHARIVVPGSAEKPADAGEPAGYGRTTGGA